MAYQKAMSALLLGASVSAMAYSAPVVAADDDKDNAVEEIIVTVNRRQENIQDVSGTVQAFSGSQLDKLGITNDFRSLQNAVTGMQIANQEGKLEVYLRGVGSSDSDFASDPSVAIHYNGVYLPRPRSIGPMFFDVERVEINKGPQGTIRGRNATGGSVNVIAKRPEDEFGGMIKVGFGNFGRQQLEGVLNLPVTDTLAVRASVYGEKADSYMTSAANPSIEAPGAQDDRAIRMSAEWNPTDNWSLYVLADKVDQKGSSIPGAFTGRALSAGYDIDDLDDPYNQYFVRSGSMSNDIQGIMGVLSYTTDSGITFEYNGSYREYEFFNANAPRQWQIGMDYPGAADEFAALVNQKNSPYAPFTQSEKSNTSINEFRIFSDDSKDFIWSVGAFRLRETFNYSSFEPNHGWWGDCDWSGVESVCGWWDGLGGLFRGDDNKVESDAFFGDFTYKVSDQFRIKAGIRHTSDKKTSNDTNVKFQFRIEKSLLEELGLATDGSDIILASDGIQVAPAATVDLSNIPYTGPSWAQDLEPGQAQIDHFLASVANFGTRDNFDDIIAADPSRVDIFVFSDFAPLATEGEWDYTDWRVGAEYDLNDDQMVYATVSTAHRAGGFNRPFGGGYNLEWNPEKMTSYEIGTKNVFDFMGYRTVLNAAAFYYDYSDMVIQEFLLFDATAQGGAGTEAHLLGYNYGDASVTGFEVDGNIALGMGFNLGWNYSYLDSELKSPNAGIKDPRSGADSLDLSGNRLMNTSKHNFNLKLSQTIDINKGIINSVDWSVLMNYRSKYFLSNYNSRGFDENGNEIPLRQVPVNTNWLINGAGFPDNNGRFLRDKVPGYTLFNVNVGVNFGDEGQYRLEGWISNLTNTTYSTKGFISQDVNIRFLNTPRMGGVRFSAKF